MPSKNSRVFDSSTTSLFNINNGSLGEFYSTYPKIVKWLCILKEHLRESLVAEENSPHFSERVVQVIKDLKGAVDRCFEKLNEDAFIAGLLDISLRDTFFSRADSQRYWDRLEELYKYSPAAPIIPRKYCL